MRCDRSIVMRRRVGGVVSPLPCRFGCPAGEGNNATLSRAKFVRAALGSGSAAPGDPCGPVRGEGTRRGRPEELNYLAAEKIARFKEADERGRICPHTAGAAQLSDGS